MRLIATMGTAALTLGTMAHAGIIINEVRTDMDGTDATEFIELKGAPGESLAGLTLLVLGDDPSSPTKKSGVLEFVWQFAATDVIGSNGFLVLKKNTMPDASIGAGTTIVPILPDNPSGVFENSQNSTIMLVSGYSGTNPGPGVITTANMDLDANDDGTIDAPAPWTAIIDSMAVKQSAGATPDAANVWWYSTATCGPTSSRRSVETTTGAVIGGWDFQTTTTGGTAVAASPATQKLFNANVGAGTLHLDGTNGSSDWYVPSTGSTGTELNAFGGASTGSVDGLSSVTSGQASLALVGGKAPPATAGPTANGKSIVFKFSMADKVGLNVQYATQRSSTGFTSQVWDWSSDGATWNTLATVSDAPGNFGLRTLPVTSALDGLATGYLRCTFSGATAETGNNRVDNVLLKSTGVPTTQIVTDIVSPFHCIRNSNGSWSVGGSSPAAGLDTAGAENVTVPSYACGDAGAGDCAVAHSNPGCSNQCCCESICESDPFCCEFSWDTFCAAAAAGCVGGGDCGGGECPADLNGDTSVDGQDLGVLLGNWGAGGATDLNGDGSVDGQDLGILLGAWGPCAG
jgi:hypothetical protein